MSDAIAGALIAGLIAAAAAIAAAAISILFAFRHDHYRRALERHHEYLSWLRGLIPESEFITSTIDQLKPLYDGMVNGEPLFCPTKQLNSDFLAAARLGIMKHPRGTKLFRPLTEAYRDVVQTNEMMKRFERKYREVVNSAHARIELSGILMPTAACMPAVRLSIQALLTAASEQEKLEADHPPTFWDLNDI